MVRVKERKLRKEVSIMNDLKDKVIIVTGGGQGLGEATTRVLSKAGATVIPVDIKHEQVKKLAEELTQNEQKAMGIQLDVSDEKNVQEVIDTVMKEYGKLDGIINNAGIDVTKSMDELSIDEWDRVVKVNL